MEGKKAEGKKRKEFVILLIILTFMFSLGFKEEVSYLLYKVDKYMGSLVIFISFWFIIFIISAFIEYRNEKDFKKYKFYIETIIAFLGIFLILGQFLVLSHQTIILNEQTKISSNQAEILERASQSIRPDLVITSSLGYRSYKISSIEDKESGSFAQIYLGITNLGKITAPFATISPKYPSTFYGYSENSPTTLNDEGIWNVENLTSLELRTVSFRFHESPWNNQSLTIGVTNITFEIDCPFCQTAIKRQEIPICLYGKDPVEECGEKWK